MEPRVHQNHLGEELLDVGLHRLSSTAVLNFGADFTEGYAEPREVARERLFHQGVPDLDIKFGTYSKQSSDEAKGD